jgi:hypothetical protein
MTNNNPWEQHDNFTGKVKVYYDNLLAHFKRFRNTVFVESGTYQGNGLNCAIQAGFLDCYSVEIHEHLYTKAVSRFAAQIATGQVHLFHGNSETVLPRIVAQLTEPATFWLDAHISANYGEKLAKNCPIFEELDAINTSAIKTHTILIDDLNCFGNKAHDNIPLEQVKEYILTINPAYKFELLDAAAPENILVAHL